MIGAGNGRSIIVSRRIDDAIAALASELLAADPSLAKKVMRKEWGASVREAVGPALAMIDLNADPADNAKIVLAQIKAVLGSHVSSYGAREFALGCTLFENAGVKPFSIGPVRFERRSDWLVRKSGDAEVSATTRRRVERAWSGKHPRKRKTTIDSIREADILKTIGNCPFVCTVLTTGLSAEAGSEKALIAARLAITAISLLWTTPSRALEGMNLWFDRRIYQQSLLAFVPGKILLSGSRLSHMPHGPRLIRHDWATEFEKRRDHFRVVGEILDYVIDPAGDAPRQSMMNALAQALLWFHEGCREASTLMAIVKFSAALDALACGGKSAGIRRLISAQLGINDNDPIRPSGPTLKQTIDKIYSDARSRTIHGTNVKFGHDWSETREVAEQFARHCLMCCIDWAATHPSSDDPRLFSKIEPDSH